MLRLETAFGNKRSILLLISTFMRQIVNRKFAKERFNKRIHNFLFNITLFKKFKIVL